VEDPWVHLQINEDDMKLVIRVEDNGSGIPSEIVSKVFNMFYRGSEKSKGNGLGLYLVEKAVNALGGTCRIESEPNEYFVFESEIPLERSI
jgi:signal transduction histidine kinase